MKLRKYTALEIFQMRENIIWLNSKTSNVEEQLRTYINEGSEPADLQKIVDSRKEENKIRYEEYQKRRAEAETKYLRALLPPEPKAPKCWLCRLFCK